MSINTKRIDPEELFDVAAYWKAGNIPWTIFAYPTPLADDQGWPPDQEVIHLFAILQQRGLRFGVWKESTREITYFAVPKEEIQHSKDLLAELESAGIIEPNFLSQRCEDLFARNF